MTDLTDLTTLTTLTGTLDAVWQRLHDGVTRRDAPARHPVLATVGAAGAEARMVVLRAADRAAALVELQSDLHAAKVDELRAEPRATLLIWDADAGLQIRLRARFDLLSDAQAEPRWHAIPEHARTLYGGTPAPGAPLPDPLAHAPGPDRAAFAVLRGRIAEIETLHLGATPHRRALFRAADDWHGGWRAP